MTTNIDLQHKTGKSDPKPVHSTETDRRRAALTLDQLIRDSNARKRPPVYADDDTLLFDNMPI